MQVHIASHDMQRNVEGRPPDVNPTKRHDALKQTSKRTVRSCQHRRMLEGLCLDRQLVVQHSKARISATLQPTGCVRSRPQTGILGGRDGSVRDLRSGHSLVCQGSRMFLEDCSERERGLARTRAVPKIRVPVCRHSARVPISAVG